MTNAPSIQPRSIKALPKLFARYVTGQINDQPWHRMMNVFDTSQLLPKERQAMASFFEDLAGEKGAEAIKVPKVEEVRSLMDGVRIA